MEAYNSSHAPNSTGDYYYSNQNGLHNSYDPYNINESLAAYDDYKQYLYEGYSFERPIYLYIWEILVIVTCLLNAVVISVLLRKRMRNPTYMILVAISVSDSLTGLVTLPTYMSVFQHFSPAKASEAPTSFPDYNNTDDYDSLSPEDRDYFDYLQKMSQIVPDGVTRKPTDGYVLSEELCDSFMISKFFLSKSFHTVSVWLTLFLALQRFLSVYSPFRGSATVFTSKKTVIICVFIFILAPVLHVYQLLKDKSLSGFCKWQLDTGADCDTDCVYLWLAFLLGHFLPSVFLIVFTVLFIYSLMKTSNALQSVGSSRQKKTNINTAFASRQRENRRVSAIVTAIVIVFLIPEVPYAGFLLYSVIYAHADLTMNHEANRAIHAAYEILLVLSFNANFYIYTFLNQRFRKVLSETIVSPVCDSPCCKKLFGFSKCYRDMRKFALSRSSDGGSAIEMNGMNTSKTQETLGESSSGNTLPRDKNGSAAP